MLEVVAVLLRSGERFLLCQRPEQKAHGLLWEFAGGKVEPGETKQEALARECREELGVHLHVGAQFMELTHPYPDLTVHLSVLRCTLGGEKPQRLEHRDMRWVTAEEAARLPLCPADTAIVQRLRQECGKRNTTDEGRSLYEVQGLFHKNDHAGKGAGDAAHAECAARGQGRGKGALR